MEIYQQIIKGSISTDKKFEKIDESDTGSIRIVFNVPSFHPRIKQISNYTFSQLSLEKLIKNEVYNRTANHVFIIDDSVIQQNFIKKFLANKDIKPIVLRSIEDSVKTKPFLDNLLRKNKLEGKQDFTIVVIGGGLLLNVGAYIAERTSANLILFPTTVLSMADSSGGKVRVNFINSNRAYKHFYKSFYEPDAMFLDERFLASLPKKQIQIGLVETIKHGLFQSPKLYDHLLKSGREIFTSIPKLKKAILWAASLKKICMEIDVEENENGSRRILRGGHDFSDRLEEDLRFGIPHGIAVAIGIINQLETEQDNKLLEKAIKIFDSLDIPYSITSYNKWI